MSSEVKLNVLVVDDEPFICESLIDLIEMAGGKAKSAANGVEALRMVMAESYDVVVTDVRMPNGNGIDFIKGIPAEIKSRMRIYLSSGFNDIDEASVQSLGIQGVLSKPFDFEIFMKKIFEGA